MTFLAVSVSAAIKCDLCKKEIDSKYITGPGSTPYCWNCYTNYSSCSACGKLFKSLIDVEDKKFCGKCYANLEKCDICREALIGSYMIYPELGMNVCDKCESTCPRCESCNRPAKKLNRAGSAMLCNNCDSRTSRCYSCGDALLDDYKYFESDQSKKYCDKCVSSYDHCADCGAPSGPRGQKLEDDRYLCPDCRKQAIFNPALITPIKQEVLEYVSKNLNIKVDHKINFSIQDKKFLERKSRGLSQDINGLFYRKGHDYDIYVLYGLRKKDLVWVLAHEITHAWQSENCSERLSTEEREGFAQWVAYHTAISFGYRQYAENMRGGESIYSSGLNRMIELEKIGGSKAVIEFITNK
jgi:hypothetical protein